MHLCTTCQPAHSDRAHGCWAFSQYPGCFCSSSTGLWRFPCSSSCLRRCVFSETCRLSSSCPSSPYAIVFCVLEGGPKWMVLPAPLPSGFALGRPAGGLDRKQKEGRRVRSCYSSPWTLLAERSAWVPAALPPCPMRPRGGNRSQLS